MTGRRVTEIILMHVNADAELDGTCDPHTDAADRQIDHLVYQVYAPTDDEIRIVEEATQR